MTGVLFGALLWFRASLHADLRERTGLRSEVAMEALESVSIGGIEQSIFVRGEDPEAPLLLWLHGGPGSPAIPNARLVDGHLVQHLIVVHWDQRGSGKSYGLDVPRDSFTVEQLVDDADELIAYLLDRFGREKLFLLGHSWGSQLGAYLVARRPERIHAWVSVGTDARTAEAEAVGYRWVRAQAERNQHTEALAELDAIGPPPYDNLLELVGERRWLDHFRGSIRNPGRHGSLLRRAFLCPEYTLLDVARMAIGNAVSAHYMVFDIMENADLFAQVPRLEVPVYFLHGRHDYNTPAEIARRYFEQLDAPGGKTWVWFENSAHSPHLEETQAFERVIVEQVLSRPRRS